jgi:hypothetical protein
VATFPANQSPHAPNNSKVGLHMQYLPGLFLFAFHSFSTHQLISLIFLIHSYFLKHLDHSISGENATMATYALPKSHKDMMEVSLKDSDAEVADIMVNVSKYYNLDHMLKPV